MKSTRDKIIAFNLMLILFSNFMKHFVKSIPETEAAFSRATLVTLVGSMIPAIICSKSGDFAQLGYYSVPKTTPKRVVEYVYKPM